MKLTPHGVVHIYAPCAFTITAALLLATAAHAAPQLERADDNNQLVVVDKSLMGQLHQVRQTMVDRTSDLVVTAIGFLGVPYRRGGDTVETASTAAACPRNVQPDRRSPPPPPKSRPPPRRSTAMI
jgi:hypothetical protein